MSFVAVLLAHASVQPPPALDSAPDPAPVRVTIDSGTLVGEAVDGIHIFRGVPYAAPPVGLLRWAPPAPIQWEGELDATKFQLPCSQPVSDGGTNGGGVSGPTSEDCLYLNLWVPEDAEGAPVMVWLHGGAGYLGAGHLAAYDGTGFAREGVVLVSINYRLGMLGNFAHPALTADASDGEPLVNYALMDAIEALRWVRRNIEVFGGDPQNVTLFGQSAGGAMVSRLLTARPARGLYHKAIIQSGANLSGGISARAGEIRGSVAASDLGLSGADATADQLRAIPVETILENEEVRRGTTGIIDGRILTMSNRDAFSMGTAFDVPLIVGSNAGEGGADRAYEMAEIFGPGAPAFQYYFTYVPVERQDAQPAGPPHSAELRYVFNSLAEGATETDRVVATAMNSCWAAFAKANTNVRTITCADGFTWEARTPENDAIAVFGDTPESGRAAQVLPLGGF